MNDLIFYASLLVVLCTWPYAIMPWFIGPAMRKAQRRVREAQERRHELEIEMFEQARLDMTAPI